MIVQAVGEALRKCESMVAGEPYADAFQRIFKERKPQYRVFLGILALCAALKLDLSARSEEPDIELQRMQKCFASARDLLQKDRQRFYLAFILAFETFAQAAREECTEDQLKIHMSNLLRRGFSNLYKHLALKLDLQTKIREQNLG